VTSAVPLDDSRFYAGDPDPVLADLRRRCPVYYHPAGNFWVLTRHADLQEVSKDPARFCSGQGVLLADRARAIAAADSILYLDPPVHGRYRKLVSRAFTPRTVATLEPRIRELAVELLDELDPTAPVDAVDALSAPLPLFVIAEMLGVPASDREAFRRWSDAIMEAATDLNDTNAALAAELLLYFDEKLQTRIDHPGDDLLSALVTATVDGERLTRDEQLGFCMTLLVAGNETTRSLITGGLIALAQHPDQRSQVVADPGLLPQAVEELLRWVTPIMAMARTATGDTAVGGEPIAQGDYVVLSYAAANRDEEAFGPDAARFDITRSPNPHLAFGFGEHNCLGAGLARVEARVLFDELLRRWPFFQLAGEPTRVPSTLLRQVAHLPILFDPSRGEHPSPSVGPSHSPS
jgi:cytochrome P450